jgi:hypothetical protein
MKPKKTEQAQIEKIQNLFQPFQITPLKIYPKSFCSMDGLTYGLIRIPQGKKLIVLGEKGKVRNDSFKGENHHLDETTLKVCDLSPENTACLMVRFPYTKPVSLRRYPVSIGTGDRLGIATPGYLRAVERFPVRPVLAQQSVRENKQTGRNFFEVVTHAAWAVFQENYEKGYGADGDHLKAFEEIEEALESGISMVTLDLKEKLNPTAFTGSREEIDQKFRSEIDEGESKVFFHLFLNKEFRFKGPQGEFTIQFNEERVKRNTLLFSKAIDFTEEVDQFLHSQANQRTIDFEIVIDEMPFPTSPENHLFFIIALSQRGIRIDSLAPRFKGEFQTGIDYKEGIDEFRNQFYRHAMIAKDYGNYKLSIHSGSDKFSVFPPMEELARERLHLKTAGASWLEAMRLIAQKAPSLYREMHRYALFIFHEATQLHHVTTDIEKISKLDEMKDKDLPRYFDQNDSRQLIHLTYEYLLNAKHEDGKYLFKERFFQTLTDHEEEYWSLLEKHIDKYLVSLGLKKVAKPHP